MALSNHERIGKALDLLAAGLKPFVGRELQTIYPDIWFKETQRTLMESLSAGSGSGRRYTEKWAIMSGEEGSNEERSSSKVCHPPDRSIRPILFPFFSS